MSESGVQGSGGMRVNDKPFLAAMGQIGPRHRAAEGGAQTARPRHRGG